MFRQAIVYKNRNRDTAWFSIHDSECPALRVVLEQWLAEENFDKEGRQTASPHLQRPCSGQGTKRRINPSRLFFGTGCAPALRE